jgi:hypothetical protein
MQHSQAGRCGRTKGCFAVLTAVVCLHDVCLQGQSHPDTIHTHVFWVPSSEVAHSMPGDIQPLLLAQPSLYRQHMGGAMAPLQQRHAVHTCQPHTSQRVHHIRCFGSTTALLHCTQKRSTQHTTYRLGHSRMKREASLHHNQPSLCRARHVRLSWGTEGTSNGEPLSHSLPTLHHPSTVAPSSQASTTLQPRTPPLHRPTRIHSSQTFTTAHTSSPPPHFIPHTLECTEEHAVTVAHLYDQALTAPLAEVARYWWVGRRRGRPAAE